MSAESKIFQELDSGAAIGSKRVTFCLRSSLNLSIERAAIVAAESTKKA